MPTSEPQLDRFAVSESHHARQMAEGFGSDPEQYDRARPRYPQAMADRIVAASPGRDVLDVGIGTGISARPFQAAGCRVVGVDVDPRMAEFACRAGFEVEVAKFEEWDAGGRVFDIVVSGQAWHWVDPVAGAAKAVEVLSADGRLAVFWNVSEFPSDVGKAFAEVYERVLPGSPFSRGTSGGLAAYGGLSDKATAGVREVARFGEPERWQFEWEAVYSRDQWLDQVPTSGGHRQFPPGKLGQLLAGMGTAIDTVGGSFTVRYTTVVITAVKSTAA